jgi:pimeloyl-ACP methyl ester carboxylesterase
MKTFSLLATLVVCCLSGIPADAADDVFDSNGVKIRYVTAGSGVPVVLIHGWMGDSSMWGRDMAGNTRLNTKDAEGFQLIALDCRGHGKSDKPHDRAKYGPEMAADVVRLLDHLKLEKAHLIGYSSGAYIVGKVAATHPDRVLSIIYGGQAPIVAGAESLGSNEVEVFAKAVEEGTDLSAYIMAIAPPGKPKPPEQQAKALAAFMFNGKDVKAFAAAGRSFPKLEVTAEQLRKCQAPVLFIHGGNETAYVKDHVAAVRKLLGRGELKIIDGSDHITTLAKPEFATAIHQFLRSGTLN